MARVSPPSYAVSLPSFFLSKKREVAVHQKWTGTPHARSALSHRSYHRDLKWQRAYKMACVPGLSSNETAGGVSDACIQRWLLGLADEPCLDPSGISWCIGLETVRTVVAAPSSISLSLSTTERKMWLIYQPIVATNILVSVIYKLDLKCSTKGH